MVKFDGIRMQDLVQVKDPDEDGGLTLVFKDDRLLKIKVVDGKLINHKEQIDCVEVKKPNVIVSAMTGENSGLFFQYVFGTLFFVVENLL